MKKLALFILTVVIGTASVFAVNTKTEKKPTKELRNEIIELIKTSDLAFDNDVTITIKFTFNSEGEMVVLCPGCDDKKMKKFISEKLNYKKFKNPGVRDKIYRMPLTFKAS